MGKKTKILLQLEKLIGNNEISKKKVRNLETKIKKLKSQLEDPEELIQKSLNELELKFKKSLNELELKFKKEKKDIRERTLSNIRNRIKGNQKKLNEIEKSQEFDLNFLSGTVNEEITKLRKKSEDKTYTEDYRTQCTQTADKLKKLLKMLKENKQGLNKKTSDFIKATIEHLSGVMLWE